MAKSKGALAKIAGQQVTLPVDQIDVNPRNCNRQPKAVFAKLVQSVREFNFIDPIIVREKGSRYEVIGGEHRLRAASVCGMPEVPAVNLGDIDDLTAARILIVLNETRGSSDQDALASLVSFIKDEGGEEALQVLPYTDAQLADLLDDEELTDLPDDEEPEDAPPEERAVKIKPADVAAMFELEGVSQDTLKAIILSIRKWRQRKSPDTPAYTFLLEIMKADR